MTIYFLTSVNPYASEGASANRWRSVIDGLVDQGVKAKLIIVSGWNSHSEFKKYATKGYIDPDKNISYEYLSRHKNFSLWSRRIRMYLLGFSISLILSFKLKKILQNQRVDILFIQPYLDVFQLYSLVINCIPDNTKVVMEINEFNDIAIEHATNYFQKKNLEKFNNLLFRNILPNLDALVVMTEKLKYHFANIYSTNKRIPVYHMPMTVDLSRFAMVKSNDLYSSPYIAYCGTTSFKKDGIDILIKAFETIANSFPDLFLYIAAYFENDGNKMLDLINNSEYKDRIVYVGTLDRDEIPVFITNSAICALPRPDSKQAQGGFPTKLGEYLASGRPVCVTAVGEIPLYLKDRVSAYMAHPGSVESFASALRCALIDKNVAERIGYQGKKVAETVFDKDIQGRKLYKYLLNLIGNAK